MWIKGGIITLLLRCGWEFGRCSYDVIITYCISRLGYCIVISYPFLSLGNGLVPPWWQASACVSEGIITEGIWCYFLVISFGVFAWDIALETVISSETVIVVAFCKWEKPGNVVVCELMAFLQLLWQLVPEHQHTSIWIRHIILLWNLLLYIYCHWYISILHCIVFVIPVFLLPRTKQSTPPPKFLILP